MEKKRFLGVCIALCALFGVTLLTAYMPPAALASHSEMETEETHGAIHMEEASHDDASMTTEETHMRQEETKSAPTSLTAETLQWLQEMLKQIAVIQNTIAALLGAETVANDTHMTHDAGNTHATHAHGMHELAGTNMPAPTVMLMVHKDPKSGWNAEMKTANFRFAPEHASQDHMDGEGHAHIYVDGVKINRVYGPWYHLGELTPGMRTVRVILSANNHDEYALNGEVIAATAMVHVAE